MKLAKHPTSHSNQPVCVYVFSAEDGEKKDQDKGKEDSLIEPSSDEEKKPTKRRPGQKKEEPEVLMASFFAGLDIYQTKILVSSIIVV